VTSIWFDKGPSPRESSQRILGTAPVLDDDEILWRILARAQLLASDDRLDDKGLLAQIRRR
jgi:hypothetical protein